MPDITTAPESAIVLDGMKTTSLIVAEAFGKRHDDVLKRIDSIEIPADYRLRNFAELIREVPVGKDGIPPLVKGNAIKVLQCASQCNISVTGVSTSLQADAVTNFGGAFAYILLWREAGSGNAQTCPNQVLPPVTREG